MIKSMGSYRRKGKYFFEPLDKTISGIWVSSSPVVMLGIDASPAELGKVMIDTLNSSKLGVPHPSDWSIVPKPLCDAAHVKSWSSLVKGAVHCLVSTDGWEISFVPTRNAGVKDGFQHLAERRLFKALESTIEEIGQAFLEALKRCE